MPTLAELALPLILKDVAPVPEPTPIAPVIVEILTEPTPLTENVEPALSAIKEYIPILNKAAELKVGLYVTLEVDDTV